MLKVLTGATGATLICLDRPRARNALDLATVSALQAAVNACSGLIVLGSSTSGIFCAGADLTVPDDERARTSDALYGLYESLVTRPGVVIAVVDGPAVGGGAQLAASADIRIASPAARFRWVGVGHGLAVGAWILPELVGRSLALELCLTTRWLPAEEAVASGFLTRLVDDPLRRADEVAAVLATAHPDAVARVKRLANTPALLSALREERSSNRAAWAGAAPTAAASAAEGRSAG
jgi:enoyl-CoA hydratase/carnithine racemase